MFKDDIDLVREMVDKYCDGSPMLPVVDIGGLEDPVIADYSRTVAEMERISAQPNGYDVKEFMSAQRGRYKQIHRPLSFLSEDYEIVNPANGGPSLDTLWMKYPNAIGTAVILSVLEHTDRPWQSIEALGAAMKKGGLVIVSTPWEFPYHAECGQDCWRFSPEGLRHLFNWGHAASDFQVLEAGFRLDVPAEAGVVDLKSGRLQAVKSSYLVARAA